MRHRYVHGGFEDSEARFSIYFPPDEKYEGRFFQYVLPVSGNEHAVAHPEHPNPSYSISFAVESGAYLVETNGGKLDFLPSAVPSITLWRTSAAVAEQSRVLANKYYSKFGPHRPYGYAWGGSGGAFKTIACIENTEGVWDGVVPFIHATPVALPNDFTVQAHAMRLLRDRMPAIVDAVDPGGSGDMYAGLNADEADALREVTRMGFPADAWFNYKTIAYGYANADIPGAFTFAELPDGDLQGAAVKVLSGAAMGATVYIAGVFGDIVSIGYGQGFQTLTQLKPGDQVEIDNSVYLAVQTYHRHQVPPREYYVYDQYRDESGEPLFPQRSVPITSLFNQAGMMSGKFTGKMIVVESLMDEIAFAWQADWYRTRVKAALGGALDDRYRLWFVEKGMHTPPKDMSGGLTPGIATRAVNFGPVLQQALRDVAAWAEKGVAPAKSTSYEVVDGQIHVPADAADAEASSPS